MSSAASTSATGAVARAGGGQQEVEEPVVVEPGWVAVAHRVMQPRGRLERDTQTGCPDEERGKLGRGGEGRGLEAAAPDLGPRAAGGDRGQGCSHPGAAGEARRTSLAESALANGGEDRVDDRLRAPRRVARSSMVSSVSRGILGRRVVDVRPRAVRAYVHDQADPPSLIRLEPVTAQFVEAGSPGTGTRWVNTGCAARGVRTVTGDRDRVHRQALGREQPRVVDEGGEHHSYATTPPTHHCAPDGDRPDQLHA